MTCFNFLIFFVFLQKYLNYFDENKINTNMSFLHIIRVKKVVLKGSKMTHFWTPFWPSLERGWPLFIIWQVKYVYILIFFTFCWKKLIFFGREKKFVKFCQILSNFVKFCEILSFFESSLNFDIFMFSRHPTKSVSKWR